MQGKIILWRLGPDHRAAEAYDRFLNAFARTSMARLRPFGLLDGFIIRLNESLILTINHYETAEQAWAAWHEVVSRPGYGAEGDLEVLFRLIAPVDDLPLLSEAPPPGAPHKEGTG